MTGADGLRRENEALRARFTALSEASLRIGASLDLETVLQEVVDSARVLTDARCVSIATIGETGAPQDFVTSGLTEEEHRRLLEWPDGPRLFEHVRDLDGPLRRRTSPPSCARSACRPTSCRGRRFTACRCAMESVGHRPSFAPAGCGFLHPASGNSASRVPRVMASAGPSTPLRSGRKLVR